MVESGQRGTTLVEMTLGLLIAVAVLGGLVAMVASQARLRQSDDELALGLRACSKQVERLRSIDFAKLPAQNGTGFAVGTDAQTGKLQPVAGDADGLPGEIEIDVEDSSGSETVYRATVRIVWAGTQRCRKLEMSCLLADRRRRK